MKGDLIEANALYFKDCTREGLFTDGWDSSARFQRDISARS